MTKKKILTLAFSVFLLPLFACSSSTEANKANFSKAIQDYLTQEKACLMIKNEYLDKGLPSEIPSFNEFTKAGLLKKERLAPKRNGYPTFRYSLTEQGKKISKVKKGYFGVGAQTGLCYGDKKIVDITEFTVPAEAKGKKVSLVKYTYEVTNVADWAQTTSVKQNIKKELASSDTPLKGKAMVFLTNNGWVHTKLNK